MNDERTLIRIVPVEREVWPHFNWASFDQDKIVSYNNYQYSPYWGVDGVLVIVRRDLRSNVVQSLRLPDNRLTIDPTDGHRNTVVGISPADGRLHLAWDHHCNDLRYTKTREGFLTDPQEKMSINEFEDAQMVAAGAPQLVTYPRFLNDGDGRLYLVYRSGGSGDGRTVICRYNATDGQWAVESGKLFGSEGTYEQWRGSESRNAYLHDILFDTENRLHVTWVYREVAETWASNHDLHYAYSDDFGVTWKNNSGTKIADISRGNSITINDPGIVVQEIPVYSWLMNQCAMVLDRDNQPHVALFKLPDTFRPDDVKHDPPPDVAARLRFFHYWRDVDGSWHSSGPLDLPAGLTISRPNIVVDKANTVIIYWRSNQGFRRYTASAADNWKEWDLSVMTGPELTSKGTCKHDRRLLLEKGILSFSAAQEEGNGYVIADFRL